MSRRRQMVVALLAVLLLPTANVADAQMDASGSGTAGAPAASSDGAQAQENVAATAGVDDEMPHVGGSWQLTYKYNEMRGDVSTVTNTNPCQGPFPYKLRKEVDIHQIKGSSSIRTCFKGDQCLQKGVTAQISKVTVDLAQSLCSFRAHDIDPDAFARPVNPFDETPVCGDGVPCVQGSSHMYDMLPKCQLDKRCNLDRPEPAISRTFSAFQLPSKAPFIWGVMCRFHDEMEKGVVNPLGDYAPYSGAWRHNNESWAFVRDVTTCPNYPSNPKDAAEKALREKFESCLKVPDGTNIEIPDQTCFTEKDLGEVKECDYMLVGTSGGAVVYPESTTGLPKVGNEPQVCWHYADITGKKVKSFEDMVREHPEWTLTNDGT